VQAERDTESSIFINFWMPVFTGMTNLIALFAIATKSRKPESSIINGFLDTGLRRYDD
jgi:hypothetical protein